MPLAPTAVMPDAKPVPTVEKPSVGTSPGTEPETHTAGSAAAAMPTDAGTPTAAAAAAATTRAPSLDIERVTYQPPKRHFAVFQWMRDLFRKQAQLFAPPGLPSLLPAAPAGAPTPAWLLLYEDSAGASARWRRVWAEVRAPGLLCFAEADASNGGCASDARYLVFAGAEVVVRAPPRCCAAEGGGTGGGVEVRVPRLRESGRGRALHGTTYWLDADESSVAKEWCLCLGVLARTPGAGFLWICAGSIWHWCWVVVVCSDDGVRTFAWYRTPGEFLRREAPLGSLNLGRDIVVRYSGPSSAFRFVVTVAASSALPSFMEANGAAAAQPSRGLRWWARRGNNSRNAASDSASPAQPQAGSPQAPPPQVPQQHHLCRIVCLAFSKPDRDRWVKVLRSSSLGSRAAAAECADELQDLHMQHHREPSAADIDAAAAKQACSTAEAAPAAAASLARSQSQSRSLLTTAHVGVLTRRPDGTSGARHGQQGYAAAPAGKDARDTDAGIAALEEDPADHAALRAADVVESSPGRPPAERNHPAP
eukprot:NODE_4404_length_1896_cov_2.161108.p1 GENE.NODE_4404_length_1896_cov_2.161108~~NODE_4404_length_1896_cov_2.161108.p1  ORF type:complete len:604 (+),score=161.46 NODE_4404_length_1896_cov_2.161108:206-1813(+)